MNPEVILRLLAGSDLCSGKESSSKGFYQLKVVSNISSFGSLGEKKPGAAPIKNILA